MLCLRELNVRVLTLALIWLFLCAFGLFPAVMVPSLSNPMCTAISGGCAEAWGMSEAPVNGYSGPLFQISNGTTTLDIGQVGSGNFKANMTTWSAFCGGTNSTSTINGVSVSTNSVCKVSKIYAEVHGSANDLVPSVFVGSGVDCSAGGLTCACKFRIENATGLPILIKVGEICEYTLTGDAAATGITAGTGSLGILYNGAANVSMECCGSFGMTHAYNAGDTEGTDFTLYTAFGQDPPVGVSCGMTTTYCLGIDEELAGDQADFPINPTGIPVLLAITHNSVANSTSAWANGTSLFTRAPPCGGVCTIDSGTSVHVGGGGDLSQPADLAMREGAITNSALTTATVTAVLNQLKANFDGLLVFGNI